MLEVKIVKLNPLSATCEVVTDEGAQRFTVSSGMEAYQCLQLVVKNAARTIAEREVDKLMRDFLK